MFGNSDGPAEQLLTREHEPGAKTDRLASNCPRHQRTTSSMSRGYHTHGSDASRSEPRLSTAGPVEVLQPKQHTAGILVGTRVREPTIARSEANLSTAGPVRVLRIAHMACGTAKTRGTQVFAAFRSEANLSTAGPVRVLRIAHMACGVATARGTQVLAEAAAQESVIASSVLGGS